MNINQMSINPLNMSINNFNMNNNNFNAHLNNDFPFRKISDCNACRNAL